MASKAQKEPSWIGGPTKGLGSNVYTNLRLARASKELKFWLSWTQGFMALTPSVKRPLTTVVIITYEVRALCNTVVVGSSPLPFRSITLPRWSSLVLHIVESSWN
jgi:hypothetical protein